MTSRVFKILGSSDLMQVPSQKADGGFILKRFVRLQEFGGSSRSDSADKASNAIIATIIGPQAQVPFQAGEIVLTSLRFSIREYQGSWYQDITVVEITKIK